MYVLYGGTKSLKLVTPQSCGKGRIELNRVEFWKLRARLAIKLLSLNFELGKN